MPQLPVGRSSLREAFLKLEGEGLVELRHQRGVFVRRMTRQAMAELFQLRECLEGFAAGLAANRVDRGSNLALLVEARRIWLDDAVLGNEFTHMENNVPLHEGIVAMRGNARLVQTLKPLDLPAYRLKFLKFKFKKENPPFRRNRAGCALNW